MSNSKFLPFQDANGDGLNDACKEEFVVTESKVCPECTPNPNAIVPNWVPRNNFSPFLNDYIAARSAPRPNYYLTPNQRRQAEEAADVMSGAGTTYATRGGDILRNQGTLRS